MFGMNRAGKRMIEKTGNLRRQFTYTVGKNGDKGFVSLDFTLRTDITDELEGFLACLEAATAEVKEELENHSQRGV